MNKNFLSAKEFYNLDDIWHKIVSDNILYMINLNTKTKTDFFLTELHYCEKNNFFYYGINIDQVIKLGCSYSKLKELNKIILKFKNILTFDISYNQIKDISLVKNFKDLKFFDCCNNSIENLDIISGMKSLQVLHCQRNKINSIKPIYNLNLISLNCSGNKIPHEEILEFRKLSPKCVVKF